MSSDANCVGNPSRVPVFRRGLRQVCCSRSHHRYRLFDRREGLDGTAADSSNVYRANTFPQRPLKSTTDRFARAMATVPAERMSPVCRRSHRINSRVFKQTDGRSETAGDHPRHRPPLSSNSSKAGDALPSLRDRSAHLVVVYWQAASRAVAAAGREAEGGSTP